MQKIITTNNLWLKVRALINGARNKIYSQINTTTVHTYWHIGRLIVEEEQQGEKRANYGKAVVESLATRFAENGEKGFDATNLWKMRQFYLAYPILDAVRLELSWTHYRLLLKVSEPQKRSFYEVECTKSKWSTRELDRQISSLLYDRLALSRDKEGLLRLAEDGAEPSCPSDVIKDPFVLEFVGLSENDKYLEKDLEQGLIDKLQHFLLELGRGFSFVARQKRITLDGDHFYIDLVFYHYVLKCFILVDLKVGRLMHQDIGQMQMYINYYERELNVAGDNPPIGIILCADKNEAVVKYTMNEDNKQIFTSKYQLELPTEDELKIELLREKAEILLYQHLNEDNQLDDKTDK